MGELADNIRLTFAVRGFHGESMIELMLAHGNRSDKVRCQFVLNHAEVQITSCNDISRTERTSHVIQLSNTGAAMGIWEISQLAQVLWIQDEYVGVITNDVEHAIFILDGRVSLLSFPGVGTMIG